MPPETVPKRMVPPCTAPVTLDVELGFESLIVPLNRDPDWVQRRVNVPW